MWLSIHLLSYWSVNTHTPTRHIDVIRKICLDLGLCCQLFWQQYMLLKDNIWDNELLDLVLLSYII
jgi:hypothetical protein